MYRKIPSSELFFQGGGISLIINTLSIAPNLNILT